MKKPLALALLASAAYATTASAHSLYPLDQDGVNVRRGPGTSHPILASLGPGESAVVLGKEMNWYKVKLKDGTVGYAAGWVARVLYDDEEQLAVVETDVLYVRAGPGTEYPTLGQVVQGQSLRLREVRGDWWRVDFQGAAGWVAGRFLREQAPAPAPQPAPQPVPAPPQRPVSGTGVALMVAQAEVRRGRHADYDRLDTVKAGEALTYVDAAEGWVQVQTPRGVRGWLPGPLVALWDGDVAWERGAHYRLDEGFWEVAFLPVRTVTPPEGLRVRQAPDLGAGILTVFPAGTKIKVLQDRGAWLHVTAAGGTTGWVAAEFTAPAVSPAAPRLQAATLRTRAPGVQQLELTGRLAGATVQESSQGSLVVNLGDAYGRRGALRVAAEGVTELAVDALGVSLGFGSPPDVRVVEQTDNRLVLELRPTVTGVGLRFADGHAIYRLEVSGQVQPATALEGGGRAVVVSLPGARLLAADLPPYVQAEQTDGNLRIRIPSVRPYALKRVEGGYDVVFYAPGLKGKLVMVDAGHGGAEPGAIAASGLQEKEVNLAVALKLRQLLEAQGARVVMTRTSDDRAMPKERWERLAEPERLRADLDWRAQRANQHQVDLFLSIHSNAGPRGMGGTETFFSSDNLNHERSRELARQVQAELLQALGRRDRDAKDSLFYVVKYADAPAALAELAFLSDPEEAKLLASDAFRQKAAAAMARAVANQFAERK